MNGVPTSDLNERVFAALDKRRGDPDAACDFAIGVVNAYGLDTLDHAMRHRLLLTLADNASSIKEREGLVYTLRNKVEGYADFATTCAEDFNFYYNVIDAFDFTEPYKRNFRKGQDKAKAAFCTGDWSGTTLRDRLIACHHLSLTLTKNFDPQNIFAVDYEALAVGIGLNAYQMNTPQSGASYNGDTDKISYDLYMIGYEQLATGDIAINDYLSKQWLEAFKRNTTYQQLLTQNPTSPFLNYFSDDALMARSVGAQIDLGALGDQQHAFHVTVHEIAHKNHFKALLAYAQDPERARQELGITEWDYKLGVLSQAFYANARGTVNYPRNREEAFVCEVEKAAMACPVTLKP